MSKKTAVSAILYNREGKFLLQLRENRSDILFPNHWNLFGGFVVGTESPDKAIVRMVKEEIGYDLKTYDLFKSYSLKWFNIYVYKALIDVPISKLKLKEGQDFKFFNAVEALNLNLAYDYKNVLREYIRTKLV